MWNRIKSVFAASRSPELTTVFSTNTDYEKAFHSPPVCYSDAFPDVPAPVQRSLPELIAAQWISGEIWPEKAPGVAADLLDMGFDTPSMRRLAGEMRVGCRADVEALVLKMLKELGVRIPKTEAEAKTIATRQISREVIAGFLNPWKAASELHRIWGYEVWHHRDLCDVAQLLEYLDCISIARGELPQLTQELIETFARIGVFQGASLENHDRPAS